MRVVGTMSFKQLLLDDLEGIVLPADLLVDSANGDVEVPQDPRFQIHKRMDNFIKRAADVSAMRPEDECQVLSFVALSRYLPNYMHEQIKITSHALSSCS